jgi:transcription antitermination factor NusG
LRQWSDRKQTVATPLFTGYLFVRMNLAQDSRLPVLRIPGIAGFVGNSAGPLPIPELQIESIRAVLSRQADCTVLPLLHEGEHVRVVRGVLAGVEGRLVRNQSSSRLILSVELIHKSLVVSVSPRDVEPLDRQVA